MLSYVIRVKKKSNYYFFIHSQSPCCSCKIPSLGNLYVSMFNALHVLNNNEWISFISLVFLYQYDTRLSYLINVINKFDLK